MSDDDDLWRPKESPAAADEPTTEQGVQPTTQPTTQQPATEHGVRPAGATKPPSPPASDETRPLTGTGVWPSVPAGSYPPSVPAPSYDPPSGPAGVPPPANPYIGPHDPHGPASQGQVPPPGPYGGPGYVPPPNPYPAPNEYAAPQSPYGAPFQPAYAGGQGRDHPSATTAMVLGIIGLVGIVLCGGLTLILSPAAWVVGSKAVREIDASPGQYAGRDRANAGKIMGIIGTVLLALGVLAIIAVFALAFAVGGGSGSGGTTHAHRVRVHQGI